MKNILNLMFLVACGIGSLDASARDTSHKFSVNEAMETPAARERLDQGISFYFGESSHPPVSKNFGEYMSNKKTNAFNKSDKEACEWVFLSAMLSFQQRAVQMGGDAVINIHSYYKKNDFSSTSEYECGAGALMAGVTFKGEVVRLK